MLLQIFTVLGQISKCFRREVHIALLVSLDMLWLRVLVLLIPALLIDPLLVLEVALALVVAWELHLTIILQQLTDSMPSNVDILCELALIFGPYAQYFFVWINRRLSAFVTRSTITNTVVSQV